MVKAKLPLLLDAVNMRTYRTPLAGGRDGLIPVLAPLREAAIGAVRKIYGTDLVRRTVVTQASPV